MILKVDFEIIGLNKLLRMHWAQRDNHLLAWEWAIRAALKGPPKPAQGKCNVKILSYRWNRLDEDNLIGGAKPCVDALRNLGLIKNDSAKFLKASYEQFVIRDRTKRTEIHIEEVTNG